MALREQPIADMVVAGRTIEEIAAKLRVPAARIEAIVSSPLFRANLAAARIAHATDDAAQCLIDEILSRGEKRIEAADKILDRHVRTAKYRRNANIMLDANDFTDEERQRLTRGLEVTKRKAIPGIAHEVPSVVRIRPLAEAVDEALVEEALA